MNEKNNTLITPEGHKLTFYERESVEINLNLAKDTLELLEEIAKKKDLSVISVIKFLISKGIRDLEPELAKKTAIKRFKNRKGVEENLEVDLAA
jgi:hypothetical protein